MRVVYFDLETGGLSENHPDIQIAAVATEAFSEIDAFEAKIQFQEETADREALRLNSYDPAVWKREARPELAVVDEFSAFLRKHSTVEMISKRTGSPYKIARLAGHNVAQFDCPRLAAMFKRHGRFLPAESYRPLDTLQLALWSSSHLGIERTSFKLTDLCKAFGINSDGAHDALADVRMCVELSRTLMEALTAGGGNPAIR